MKKGILLIASAVLLTACSTHQPAPVEERSLNSYRASSSENICNILEKNPQWKISLKKAEDKWKVPPFTVLAIMKHESNFKANARPIKNGKRISSAFGFSQALDGTWKHYKNSTKNHSHKRNNFDHAANFIGWYSEISRKELGISKWDLKQQYLAYWSGHGGYKKKVFLKDRWIIDVAEKVESSGLIYKDQLRYCL